MAVQPVPYRFTVEEYCRMAEVGLLPPDARVELLEGEIVQMAAISSRHAQCVNRLTHLLVRHLDGRAWVSVQNPVRLDRYSEPHPDLSLLRLPEARYEQAHPAPEDVLVVVEVADTSVGFDRRRKVPLYARRGITEVWLVDLVEAVVDRYTQPAPEGYGHEDRLTRGQYITPSAFPEVLLAVADFLPPA